MEHSNRNGESCGCTKVKCNVTKCANHSGSCGCSLDSVRIGCDQTGCTNCESYENK